jgi:hypothetical protein
MSRFRLACALCFLLLLIPICVYAKDNPEQTQFSRDIRVDSGQSVGDVTCINCSVYIAGQSNGEVTALHGNVILEPGGSVGGDVTAIWGDVRLRPGAQIGGDVTAVAGAVRRDPQSTIGGDVTSLEGAKWLLAMILPPLFILGLIVALIIWLVQRARRPAQMPQGTLAPQR